MIFRNIKNLFKNYSNLRITYLTVDDPDLSTFKSDLHLEVLNEHTNNQSTFLFHLRKSCKQLKSKVH